MEPTQQTETFETSPDREGSDSMADNEDLLGGYEATGTVDRHPKAKVGNPPDGRRARGTGQGGPGGGAARRAWRLGAGL